MTSSSTNKLIIAAFIIAYLVVLPITASYAAVAYQPDVWVQKTTGWYGDNIYENSPVNQVLSSSVNLGVKASYTIRLQNDGNQPDVHRLTGSAVPTGWTVKLTEVASGVNITSSVLGSGFIYSTSGALRNILVEVTPSASITLGAVFDFVLTLESSNNNTKLDKAKISTTVNGTIPDGQIRLSDGTFVGQDVYSTDRTVQFTSRTVQSGSTASFVVRVQNDGNVAGTFTITGTGSSTGWTVTYYEFSGGADITSAVTGAGKTTPSLSPGASYYVLVAQVQTAASLSGVYTYNGHVSMSNGTISDVVGYDVTTTTVYHPDAMVYEATTTSYIGNNTYNSSAAGQTENRNLGINGQTTYYVRMQNDGNVSEPYIVTGPAGSGNFIITYIDSLNGNNVTTDVTGAGWTTSNIPVGSTRAMKVIVKALNSAIPSEVLDIDVNVTSSHNNTISDTVSAVTTIAP